MTAGVHVIAAIVALAAWIDMTGAQAAPVACRPYSGNIRVAFETRNPPTDYNNTLNVTGIRNLFHARGMAVAGPHTEALGVTYVSPVFGLEARTRFEQKGATVCAFIESVKADFGFHDSEVYIASEYPPGSCEYNAIRDHENQHVAINNRALKEMAPRIRAELERLLETEKPMVTTNPKAVTQEIIASLSRRMEPALSAFQRVLAERNAVIDTAHNYRETSRLCQNWDRGNVWPTNTQR